MSWARDLIQVPTLLMEIVQLLREQNNLQRELITSLTGRAPLSKMTTPSQISVRPPLKKKYTAADVTVVTREMRLGQQAEEEQRAHPWHAGAEPEPEATDAPPSSDDAAVPTSPSASPPPSPASPSPPQP